MSDIEDDTIIKNELHKLNRSLRVITECNQAMIRATDEIELMNNVCRIITDIGGYKLAWVGYAIDDKDKNVKPVAQAGYEEGYLDTLNISWDNVERGQGPTGTAIRTGLCTIARDIITDPNFTPWRTEALKRGYESSMVLPIKLEDKILGALNIYSPHKDAFNESEIALLKELADDLSYGITALRNKLLQLKTEKELKQAMDDWKSTFDSMADIITIQDTNFNIMASNKNANDLLSMQPVDNTKGLKCFACFHNTNEPPEFCPGCKSLKTLQPCSEIIYDSYLDKHLEVRAIPRFDANHQCIGLIHVVRDITERINNELALHNSEKRYHSILNASPENITITDITGNILMVSPAGVKMFGWNTEAEVIGKSIYEFIIAEDKEMVIKNLSLMHHRIAIGTTEYRAIRADGKIFDIEVNSEFIRDKDDNPERIVIVIRNISERKQIEATKIESEDRLNRAEKTAKIGNWKLMLNTREMLSSEGARIIYGVESNNLPLSEIQMIPLPEYRDMLNNALTNLVQNDIPYNIDFKIKRVNDGKIIDIHSIADYDKENNIVFGVIHDVTDFQQMEKSLRESEEKYRFMTENSSDVIWHLDNNYCFDFVSSADERMRGFKNHEVIGTTVWSVLKPEGVEYIRRRNIERLRDEENGIKTGTISYELEQVCKDGNWVWTEVNVSPHHDKNGTLIGLHGVTRDISERRRIEEAIRESEERYRSILNATPDNITITDLRGNIIMYSPASLTMFQLDDNKADELLGRNIMEFIHPEDINRAVENFTSLVKTGISIAGDYRGIRKDGSIINIEVKSEFIRDANGNSVNIVFVVRDITERKAAEKALKESENRLKDLIYNMVDWVWEVDSSGRYTFCSPQSIELFGLTPEEILGKTPFDMMPADEAEKIASIFNEIAAKKAPVKELENWNIGKNGEKICLLTDAVPILDEKGNLTGYRGVDKNITERKLALVALQESERKLKSYVDFAPHAIFVINADGYYIDVNSAACKMTGYNKVELLSKHLIDLIHDESVENAKNHNNRLIKDGFATGELKYVKKDGSAGFWTVDAVKLSDDIYVGFVIDITERKHAEVEKEKLVNQLQHAQKMESVGRLAGGVAHDFNNMLQAILGNADMAMEMISKDNPIRENLEEICTTAERSADLTRQLLAFARKQTVMPTVLNLNDTVSGMIKMLKRLIGENIELNWLPGDGLWQIKVDPSQIDQILANLCVNSRDAITGVGKISIETVNITLDQDFCESHVEFTPGDYIVLMISDTGCGMNKDTMSQLFEPFFTTKGIGKGTGLGLSTVYGAVKQNNGQITVYSEIGEGTTFMIYLPRYADKAHLHVNTDDVNKPYQRGKETILLVEDEITILKLTTAMLERLGYNVLSANSPGEAIQLADDYTDVINLVMTDVVMPEMNGRELVKSLLKIYPDVKRLFMSGYTADVIAHHGVLDENINFLQKPFSMKELSKSVRDALS